MHPVMSLIRLLGIPKMLQLEIYLYYFCSCVDRGGLIYPTVEFVSRLWVIYKFVRAILSWLTKTTYLLTDLVEFLLPKLEEFPTYFCEIARPGENNETLLVIILRKFLSPLLANKSAVNHSLGQIQKTFVPVTKNRRLLTLKQ